MTPRILLVDDDPINLEILEEYLEDFPCEVTTATGAEAAWQRMEQGATQFDLILLDRMMPEVSGMVLLARIKASPRHGDIPVILQTAACAPEQVEEGLRAGAYYYLTKPFERGQMLAIARAALDDAHGRQILRQRLHQQAEALALMDSARFTLSTLSEAHSLAIFLAQLTPAPERSVVGLSELLVNAIEHGNLEIGYREKGTLRRHGRWNEEIADRLSRSPYRERRVTVEFIRQADRLDFRVTDEGRGFDWQAYLDFSADRAFDPNGRGIALAHRASFDMLRYEGCGNVACATILLVNPPPSSPPSAAP